MAIETAARVCVTGASGRAGGAVVRELLEHGYDVAPTDLVKSETEMLRADLTDYGQALGALEGAEAVIHLGTFRGPTSAPRLSPSTRTW
jgi:nucleoside-diphosphate-sugar epimerase